MPIETNGIDIQCSELAALQQEFAVASERARRLVAPLTAEQLQQRPRSGKWSIAECILHLSLTTRAYLEILDPILAEARRIHLFGTGPFKMDLAGRLLKWSLEPPARLRFKTTAPFQPGAIASPEKILPEFLQLQAQLITRILQADGLAIDKIRVPSPFNSTMQYNLLACFAVLAAHERRHLWQAEQVKKAIDSAAG